MQAWSTLIRRRYTSHHSFTRENWPRIISQRTNQNLTKEIAIYGTKKLLNEIQPKLQQRCTSFLRSCEVNASNTLSGTCGGQNHNKNVSGFFYAVQTLSSLGIIEHKWSLKTRLKSFRNFSFFVFCLLSWAFLI